MCYSIFNNPSGTTKLEVLKFAPEVLDKTDANLQFGDLSERRLTSPNHVLKIQKSYFINYKYVD